jgi:uncharacterized protein (DUF4415 family)
LGAIWQWFVLETAKFENKGIGYYRTRINAVLKAYVQDRKKAS